MQRPTVHDVAKIAGVSLATVDRVLNSRPGVREKTIARVQDAIREIGYVRDVAAANLAKQKTYRFKFILPARESAFIRSITTAIAENFASNSIERTNIEIVRVPINDPFRLVDILAALEPDQVDGVAIMAPETPQLRDAITHLKENGVAVVAVISDLPNSQIDHFIGINNIAAGRTAGVLMGRFLGKGTGKVLVITGSMQVRDHAERRLGFDQVMAQEFPDLEIMPSLEGWDDPAAVAQLVRTALENNPDIRGIYSLGAGNRGLISTLREAADPKSFVVVAHELTEHSRAALNDRVIDALIIQDIGHIVRSAIRKLKATTDRRDIITSQEHIRIEIILQENLAA